jgi:hypothetical protein
MLGDEVDVLEDDDGGLKVPRELGRRPTTSLRAVCGIAPNSSVTAPI